MDRKKKYAYFVNYAHKRGFGTFRVFLDNKINSIVDIENLSTQIAEENEKIDQVAIINWRRLRGDDK